MTVEDTEHVLNWLDSYEKAQREANEQLNKGR